MRNNLVQKYSLMLSSSEIGLGSLLHGFKIPLGGHLLSLNQAILLVCLSEESEKPKKAARNCCTVSLFSSALKLLSPMGKKLTPMLAIAIQGGLFSLAVLIFGINLAGLLLGTALLSLWGALQSILFAVFFFGKPLIDSVIYFNSTITQFLHTSETAILSTLIAFIALKVIIAMGLVWLIKQNHFSLREKYQTWLLGAQKKWPKPLQMTEQNTFIASLKDLLSYWFLFSLSLTVAYAIFVQKLSTTDLILYCLRPTFFAWISFYLARQILKVYPALAKAPQPH